MKTSSQDMPPWWAMLLIIPVAVLLSPIGTCFLTAWFHLNFYECCILIAAQIIIFTNLAFFAGGENNE
jgi:hypothetical protein